MKLEFAGVARASIEGVIDRELEAINAAASTIVDHLERGGIVQAFGTGHSRIVTLELAARAGGLVPVSMLAVKDLVMFGDVNAGEILDPTFERQPGIAAQVYELAEISPEDVFVIVSNSGINSAIVEMATLARERGHPVVAITSRNHTEGSESRDPSGRRLIDLADIVIDNGAPLGDAAVPIGDVSIGAVSSITGVLIAQLLTEAVCRGALERGIDPPVYVSANLPHGDRHNESVRQRYGRRVRPIEP